GIFNGTMKYGIDSITSPTGGVRSTLFVHIDTAGNLIEMSQLQGSVSELGRVIVADKAGSMYLGGEFTGNIAAGSLPPKNSVGGNTDFFLVKYGYDCNCM